MLGTSHALVGATGFALGVAPAMATMGHGLKPSQIAFGTLVAAGASLLPDLDTQNSTLAHKAGIASSMFARLMGMVFGGHRNGTHSLLFVGLIAYLVLHLLSTEFGVFIQAALAYCFAFLAASMILPGHSKVLPVVVSVAVAAFSFYAQVTPELFALLVATGCVLHMIGDILTPQGVPVLWPMKARLSIPVIGRTGDWREKIVCAGCWIAMVWSGFEVIMSVLA